MGCEVKEREYDLVCADHGQFARLGFPDFYDQLRLPVDLLRPIQKQRSRFQVILVGDPSA